MSHRNRRAALTLMELVVVLVILVALAAIVIPLLPNMLTRAKTSVGATNCGEINKLVQIYQQTSPTFSYPNDLDALTDTAGSGVPDYVHNEALQLSPITLTPPQALALNNAGIIRVAEMLPNRAAFSASNTPTFNPYTGPATAISITTGTTLVQVSEAAVESTIVREEPDPLDPTNQRLGDVYVVLGFGRRCTMIGKVTADPPTQFGDGQTSNPSNYYARYGLVFRVTRGSATGGQSISKAVFVGSVALTSAGIISTDQHIEQYNLATKSE